MKRRLSAVLLMFTAFTTTALFANEALIEYVEGNSSIFSASGSRRRADFGEPLSTGDTVVTGTDGIVELSTANGDRITIQPDTVFSFRRSAPAAGREQTVLACTVGEVRFKFVKLLGREEPGIMTGNTLAGIRGTEFTIFAGADGSSLYFVQEGAVEVQASGGAVLLAPGEGVEIPAGEAPGGKITVFRGQLDYRSWNGLRRDLLLADPAGSAERIEGILASYVANIQELAPIYRERRQRLEVARTELEQIARNEGAEARKKYYEDTVYPLELETSALYVNIRFYALSALSLRRYVLGRMYLSVKAEYLNAPASPAYQEFLSVHERILSVFEAEVVPYLVKADLF